MAERDNRGRFVKGNKSGNGRPKVSAEFKLRARQYAEEALGKLAQIMRKPDAKDSDVIRACELLIERAYGKCAPHEDESKADNRVTVVFDEAGPKEWNE